MLLSYMILKLYLLREVDYKGASCILWTIVDGLLIRIANNGTHMQGHADDITIMAVGKLKETMVDIINQRLE